MKIHNDIIDRYDNILKKYTKNIKNTSKKDGTQTEAPHLRFMLGMIRDEKVSGEKAHRWLGFIQGVMIANEWTTVNEEREFTKPYFSKSAVEEPVISNDGEATYTVFPNNKTYTTLYLDTWRDIFEKNYILGPWDGLTLEQSILLNKMLYNNFVSSYSNIDITGFPLPRPNHTYELSTISVRTKF